MNLESHFWQKRHNGDHGDTVYTIQSSSNHSHTSNKEREPLKEQWISLLEVQHSMSCWERVLKSWYYDFVWNLRVVLGINHTMRTIWVSQIQSKAPLTILPYLGKDMKHSSSNECCSHPITFAHSNSDILHKFWESFLAEITQWGP